LSTEEGTAVFSDQLLAFNANYPDLETRVEQKPVVGQGGILSYLRTGANVAPSILPDLIVLPTSHLETAAREGLIYPLDEFIEPALLEDLYPAAQTLAHVDDQTYGFPFAITNLTHLVYQSSAVTSTIPLLWNELLDNNGGQFVFPAAGAEGATMGLQFYLANGGTLMNEAEQPALDAPLLTQTLQQFYQGRTNEFILFQSSNTDTLDESWQLFQAGTAVYALTNAHQFLTERTPESTPGFAVMAGPGGPLTPLVDGWVWAISTADPTRRALAAELIALLIDGANVGEWNLASNYLPARREAFSVWPHDDAYLSFIHLELERAQPIPLKPNDPIMEALRDAVFAVVSLTKSPEEAAGEAMTAVQP
jgi:ABC-type glycerol-3-phosphate transport system substrate-binding protein